jgi:hypothetical protein
MRLRNFFKGNRPFGYELLTYHSLVLEVICNIGELSIRSKNLKYLDESFKELKISFELGKVLECSYI